MTELTLEQLRFAREIGATHYWLEKFYKADMNRRAMFYVDGSWVLRDSVVPLSNNEWDSDKINFTPLDEARQPGPSRVTSDGSTASYYELPSYATELQHLIGYRNMNAQDGEIFRAIYRKGRASHSGELRDAKKVLFYAKAEVERLERAAQELGK